MAVLTMPSKISGNGINQGALFTLLTNLVTVINEVVDDHATTKTAVDELNTLTDELRADHATFITLTDELHDDHAINKTMTDEIHVDVDLNGAALEAILTKLDNDAGITDTNYVAVHGRAGSGTSIQAAAVAATDVATITAGKVSTITAGEASAGPATLTNATNLTLGS